MDLRGCQLQSHEAAGLYPEIGASRWNPHSKTVPLQSAVWWVHSRETGSAEMLSDGESTTLGVAILDRLSFQACSRS